MISTLTRPDSETEALTYLVRSLMRRMDSAPDTQAQTSRLLLSAAIALYAAHSSNGAAAVACAETIADLAQAERGRL